MTVKHVRCNLWATPKRGPNHLTAVANDLFHQILPPLSMESSKAASYALLGALNYLQSFPGASAVKRFLLRQYTTVNKSVSTPDWIEKWNSPDWPVAAQACCVAGRFLNDDSIQTTGRHLITQLGEATENGTVFFKKGSNSVQEELPTTAATFIEAVGASYWETREPDLLILIRSAVDWFLGANRQKTALYNFSTGGCHDAMTATGINRNQGMEATVYCQLGFLSLNNLIGLENTSKQK